MSVKPESPPSIQPTASGISVLFNTSKTIWLAPNELCLSQIKRGLFQSASGAPIRLETFNSLERSLAGELSSAEADALGRNFILYDLARPLAETLRDSLSLKLENISPAELKKLADDLGDAFDRLKLAGLSWEQAAALPPHALGRAVAELGRLHDARLKEMKGQDRFSRRLEMLNELKSGRRFRALSGVEKIICRWSQRLSPFETDFIMALASSCQVRISLKIPTWVLDENIDNGSGFDLLRTIRRIEKCDLNSLWLDFKELSEDAIPPPLAYAAEKLLAPPSYRLPNPPAPMANLRLIAAPTAYHEVEEAARRLKEIMLEGAEPEDLALVVPDMNHYAPLIDDVARRFGLAFHFRRGRPLLEYGPVKAALDILDLWSSNWERSRLAEFLRSPYFIFNDPPLDPALINRLTLSSGMSDRRAGGGFELLSKISGIERELAEKLLNIFRLLEAVEKKQPTPEAGKSF